MKEYINKTTGEYRKTAAVVSGEQWIEVLPQHSFAFKRYNGDVRLSHSFSSYFDESLLWSRAAKPEALPFVDDEPSLNDQYAEIEQVRKEYKLKNDMSVDDYANSLRCEDTVKHPSHYASGEIECIDAMQAMMTHEQFIGFLRGNVFKYQWRYDKKNGLEDLKKSQWYLDKLMSLL